MTNGHLAIMRLVPLLALSAVALVCLLEAGTASESDIPAKVSPIELCSDITNRISLEAEVISSSTLQMVESCNSVKTSMVKRTFNVKLPFTSAVGKINSLYSAEFGNIYESTGLFLLLPRIVTIKWKDGRACATVIASAQKYNPAPKRFVDARGRWGDSIDVMVNDTCSLMIVYLGNKAAVLSLEKPAKFKLYDVGFSVAR